MPRKTNKHRPNYSGLTGGYLTATHTQLQAVALPGTITCARCKKSKNSVNEYSETQLANARYQIWSKTPGTKVNITDLMCMVCLGGPVTELQCTYCDEWKDVNEYSKKQRKDPDTAKCMDCINEQVAMDPSEDRRKHRYDEDGFDNGDAGGSSSDDDGDEYYLSDTETRSTLTTNVNSLVDLDEDEPSISGVSKDSHPSTSVTASTGGVRLPSYMLNGTSRASAARTVVSRSSTALESRAYGHSIASVPGGSSGTRTPAINDDWRQNRRTNLTTVRLCGHALSESDGETMGNVSKAPTWDSDSSDDDE